jgi:hypothetical protein
MTGHFVSDLTQFLSRNLLQCEVLKERNCRVIAELIVLEKWGRVVLKTRVVTQLKKKVTPYMESETLHFTQKKATRLYLVRGLLYQDAF